MNRPRLVTIEFVNENGHAVREDYVFYTPEQMITWLDEVDAPRLPVFGVGAVMTVRYVAVADPPPIEGQKNTRKTAAKKAAKTASRRSA